MSSSNSYDPRDLCITMAGIDLSKRTKMEKAMDDITPENISTVYSEIKDLTARDSHGRTFLYLAVKFNDLKFVKQLLKDGADPLTPKKNKNRHRLFLLEKLPIMSAVKNQNIPMMKLLLSYTKDFKDDKDDLDSYMFMAADVCSIEIMEFLLPHVKDINDVRCPEEDTLLSVVLNTDCKVKKVIEMVRFLLKCKVRCYLFNDLANCKHLNNPEIQRLLVFNYTRLNLTDGEVIETKDGKFKLAAV